MIPRRSMRSLHAEITRVDPSSATAGERKSGIALEVPSAGCENAGKDVGGSIKHVALLGCIVRLSVAKVCMRQQCAK